MDKKYCHYGGKKKFKLKPAVILKFPKTYQIVMLPKPNQTGNEHKNIKQMCWCRFLQIHNMTILIFYCLKINWTHSSVMFVCFKDFSLFIYGTF